MVFFTCNHCGSALKKNKVEKHYAVECRKPPSLSCMDCLKDFYDQEYVGHKKCISEEQKYSGQPVDTNSHIGKGERKQKEWVETLKQIVETKGSSLTSQERQLLESLLDFENIPRKKNKFQNFLKNAMGRYIDPRTIEKVWSLLEGHKSEAANNKEKPDAKEALPSPTKEAEDNQTEPVVGKKKKKDKTDVSGETEELGDADKSSQNKTVPKLSKKERKELKKNRKYELELESVAKEKQVIENDNNLAEEDMELDQGETQIEEKGIKNKKSKKKKRDKVKEEANAEGNIDGPLVNGKNNAEKKKKRKYAGNAEDDGEVKKRLKGGIGEPQDQEIGNGGITESDVNGVIAEDVKGKKKFKWDKTIVSILKTVPDNELLVKRLRKKVFSEYQEALENGRCQELSLEEAMGMFERKLHKIPGVKVHKDKAKLVKIS